MNKMIKSLIGVGLVSVGFLCAHGASAAKFDAQDVSSTKLQCGVMGNPNWCYGYPEGTVNITITPDQWESAADVTDVYVVATYQGRHIPTTRVPLTRNSGGNCFHQMDRLSQQPLAGRHLKG